MNENMEIIKEKGKCCFCRGTMNTSEFVNIIHLNKKAEWEYPHWDNLLLKDEYDHVRRACSFLCDQCIEENRNPIFAYSMDDGKIFYYMLENLHDTFQIKEEMLKL